MANGWQHAGEVIATRRRVCGYRTQLALAKAIGVSESTIGSVEKGTRNGRHSPGLFDSIEAALGWMPGSIVRVAEGGRPKVATDPYLARVHSAWPHLQEQTKKILVEWVETAVRG